MTFFRAVAVFAAASAAVAAASAESGDNSIDAGRIPKQFGRYEVILDKSPFGAPPPSSGGDVAFGVVGSGENAGDAGAMSAPPEAAPLKMSAISRFGGVPAAGFVDGETGQQFLLRRGETFAGYKLLDIDLDVGAAVVARGTNEWLLSLSWAQGQPTNIVPSARDPYFTAFRPIVEDKKDSSKALRVAPPRAAAHVAKTLPPPPPGFLNAAEKRSATSFGITPEEEAELVARATVADPDGSSHVSFRELNRLRAQLRRRKAMEARALEIEAAEAASRRAENDQESDPFELSVGTHLSVENEDGLSDTESNERLVRKALIGAIANGYVPPEGEVMELTDDEAEELRDAGFIIPEN